MSKPLSIILLPLISAIFCAIFKNTSYKRLIGAIASLFISISAILAINLFTSSLSQNYLFHVKLFSWLRIDSSDVSWSIYADHLTLVMYLVVCCVSAVVHIYSIGYMLEDPRFNLFMAYISLFTFFMLVLVSADNLLQLFFGWEGVGLCSYLLIGFWYSKDSASIAAQKAFIVNRFADVALLIGILIIYKECASFDFFIIAQNYLHLQDISVIGSFSMLDLSCLLLFIGCMAKSAQIGLHVWLPDAMEGPTPVSALIHAATMVTAGVFLILRMHDIFEHAYITSKIILGVGTASCFICALVALTQSDIKKIIAYSTCSQLGYMFIACGLFAYHAAIFHLVTHAFYKAALFLCAGNVIHATGQQELSNIGNVRRKMKVTFVFFLIASAAIVGIFPLAGFYSKDLILEYAHQFSSLSFLLGVMAAFYTGCYSVKILKNIFMSTKINSNAHEVSLVMLLPMLVLTFASIVSGYFGLYFMHIDKPDGYFSYLFKIQVIDSKHGLSSYAPLLGGVLGAIFGYIYSMQKSNYKSKFLKAAENKFYFDEVYNVLIVKTTENIALIVALFDKYVIDKLGPKGFVAALDRLSRILSRCHNGYIFSYSLWILISLFLITTYLVINIL
jgi:NADH-quinone oxidoreductase subunit L